MDFALNPLAERADRNGFGLFVFEDPRRASVLREAFGKSSVLVIRLQPRYFEGMSNRQLSDVESLLKLINQMQQAQPRINIFFRAPDFLGERLDRVGVRLQLHEGGIPRASSSS